MDYTQEGIVMHNKTEMLHQVTETNKQLRRLNRKLAIAVILGIGFIFTKYGNKAKEFITKKGE